MKELQSDFTTPEQSKRLLELGLPADSADCYYQNALPEPKIIPCDRKYQEYINSLTGMNREIWYFNPCWSVGRLVEIFCICAEVKSVHYKTDVVINNLIETVICDFEYGVTWDYIDFSKLEG